MIKIRRIMNNWGSRIKMKIINKVKVTNNLPKISINNSNNQLIKHSKIHNRNPCTNLIKNRFKIRNKKIRLNSLASNLMVSNKKGNSNNHNKKTHFRMSLNKNKRINRLRRYRGHKKNLERIKIILNRLKKSSKPKMKKMALTRIKLMLELCFA